MIKPFFTAGAASVQPLSAGALAGDRVLQVPTPSAFTPGQVAFVSDLGGAGVQCLGPVRSVGETSIAVAIALDTPRAASAPVWRAASQFAWPTVSAAPRRVVHESGVAIERSTGGALWSVRAASPWEEETLHFEGLAASDFDAFLTWLGESAQGGLDPFTWVDEAANVARVKMAECRFDLAERPPGNLAVALRLAILARQEVA